MVNEHFIVVAYDISNDRRRTRLADLLNLYGKRANFSVFECMLSSKDLSSLLSRISDLIHPRQDRVLVYTICKSCYGKCMVFGKPIDEPPVVESD